MAAPTSSDLSAFNDIFISLYSRFIMGFFGGIISLDSMYSFQFRFYLFQSRYRYIATAAYSLIYHPTYKVYRNCHHIVKSYKSPFSMTYYPRNFASFPSPPTWLRHRSVRPFTYPFELSIIYYTILWDLYIAYLFDCICHSVAYLVIFVYVPYIEHYQGGLGFIITIDCFLNRVLFSNCTWESCWLYFTK